MSDRRAPRRGTSTSEFGVSRRENHDASAFYERFTPPALSDDSEVSPRKEIDEIFRGDARDMEKVDDASVALVVTSPPYFAGKAYETALGEGHVPATYADYLRMLEDVFAECVRTLEPGGRIAVNVANLGRKPYRSLSGDIVWILQDRLRLLLRGEVVWVKARGAGGSCAWGSFQRPANPVLRDLTERVVIASKGRFDRALSPRQRAARALPHEASISRDEFMEATTDVWELPTESASRVGHPAPFPVELPERLIHLFTYRGDLVLDPFMGSGSTAVAAVRAGRHYVGYDTEQAYVDAARERVRLEAARHAGDGAAARLRVTVGAGTTSTDEPFPDAALRDGRAAKDVAREALERSGFVDVRGGPTPVVGVDVDFAARDAAGNAWHFDVAGGFTTRPGLKRADALWKVLGKAAVLHQLHPEIPYVVLTTDLPANDAALAAVRGAHAPVRDVIVLHDGDDLARLRVHATGRA